ncbi:MAG: hypothetical protein K2I82_06855 [Ruminococcus sp.]|nr:hypothetical protein [Ruminococcus sp.]
MKKIISLLLVFSGLTASLTGCSGSSVSDSGSTSRKNRVSSAPIDSEIIGKWWNGENGYIFDENRKVSLVMDFSAMEINFTDDGQFNKAGEIIGGDDISYDGKNLMVTYISDSGIDIIVNMERKDDENLDSFDGVYNLHGGVLIQYFAEMVGLAFETVIEDENINIEAKIDGESFVLTLENYCDYETIGNSLEMFSQYMNYADTSADCVKYSYEIADDTLTMTYTADSSAPAEVYKRAEE